MENLLKKYENGMENKTAFECIDLEKEGDNEKESKKCTILQDQDVKFEYYLKDNDDYTMIPSRIYAMLRNKTTGE